MTAKEAIITLGWKQIIGCENRELKSKRGLGIFNQAISLNLLTPFNSSILPPDLLFCKRTNQVTVAEP